MIRIVPMTNEHLESVMKVETESFSIPWSRKSFEDELKTNKLASYFVALEDETVVGYVGMWHIVNEGHITNIAVSEGKRHQKIGDALMKKIISVAVEKEMIGLTLEVRVGNANAMRLYNKNGFKVEGIRKNYYADTKEDAIVMWKYF